MNTQPTESESISAVQKGRGTLWMVWLIPLVALVTAGWMVYKHYRDAGVDIVITFANGSGIQAGKTALMYNGIRIGTVSDVQVNGADLGKVDVTVAVHGKAATAVARKGSRFVKVEPKVSMTEVKGLDTIIAGVYIDSYPSADSMPEILKQPRRYTFEAISDPLPGRVGEGLYVTLNASDAAQKVGSPVLFRHFVVGEVVEQNLSASGVQTLIYIKEPYAPLVKEQSRFWKLSGIDLRATMAGIKFRFDSLATLVAGGIVFDSPEDSPSVKSGNVARMLFESQNEAYLDDQIITLEAKTAYSIDPAFASVYYRGIRAGRLIRIEYLPSRDVTRMQLKLETKFRHLANEKAWFWIVRPEVGLQGIKGLDAIANGPYVVFDTTDAAARQTSHFALHETPPKPEGKEVLLRTTFAGSVPRATTLFYHDVPVGSVTDVELMGSGVHIHAVIAPRHAMLVNDSTRFYMRSGIEIDAGFSGVHVDTGSLEMLAVGGVALETIDTDAKVSKQTFDLFKNRKAMLRDLYLSDGGMEVRLKAPLDSGIEHGTPVMYGPLKAGEVLGIEYRAQDDTVVATLFIKKNFAANLNASTRFEMIGGFAVNASLSGISLKTQSIEQLIRGGVRFSTPDVTASSIKSGHGFVLFDESSENFTTFTLIMPRGKGLHVGSSLRYRDLEVGKVATLRLSGDAVEAEILIENAYADLLRDDSWIWLDEFRMSVSGVENPSAALFGPSVMIAPGLAEKRSKRFVLAQTPPPPTYGKQGLRIVLEAKRRSSLQAGSIVHYRQVKIGSVESYALSDDASYVNLVCYIDPQYAHLIRSGAKFYNATALGMEVDLSGLKVKTESIETMLRGGIGMVVPDVTGREVGERHRFVLYDEPEEAWFEWAPKL